MNLPSVSAVMLVTWPRRAAMIQDALLAYQLQLYPRRELVVVNDGAPARCAAPDVRVINLPARASIGAKRNVGLVEARGDYVATWDDDDFALPEHIFLRVALARAGDAAFVRGDRMWLADASLHVVGLERGAALATALYDRDVARRVGGFLDVSYGEDGGFFARVLLRGYRTATGAYASYVHRRHGDNVTTAAVGESFANHVWYRVVHTDVGAINARLRELLARPRTITLESV